ncbi:MULTISPECIES: BMP family lipoprotein [Brevibacillus]|jgi:basic membrane protein A|uniref:BMP family protein n=1 Tax=Brevibacillus thermoruber TaxID=33942 RepID=A0A9X3Z218_9BACL|nr:MULTISPECIES: BMP family protein [Brevibacillus]MDA5107311.1 BMP family protein [Brevibacillus thermoruber]UYZ11423.1 BMP family protein [Brevibacillus sp. WF146]
MKKVLSVLSVAALSLSLVLAGCGGKTEGQQGAANQGEGQAAAPNARIGMVTDVGGVNDNSFNQSAWEGLQKLQKDLNLPQENVNYLQSTSDADYIPNLTQFVKDKWDLTWGIGFLMGDHVKKVASENPDAKLAIIDAEVDAPNVESVLFKEHEGSFLVGVVAAKMSKTKKVGFVGGMEIPVIKRFEAGFEAGVKAVDPSVQVVKVYTAAFDKPDQGKSTASQMYDQGVDIIFHASGATGDGVFNEAKARKAKGQQVWVIGVDKDQSLTFGDDITLTSMVKRVDEAVYRVSKDVIDGKFKGGIVWLGLKENGVGLADTSNKNVPADVLKLVDEYKQKIVNGEIKVPETPQQ